MTGKTAALWALAAGLALAGCSKTAESDAAPATTSAGDITLPAAQRARVHSLTLASTPYAATVQTTGTVAFDGDQSTQVLAPISGPATRILVEPGVEVRRGQPLAYVSSPDFASAVAGFRKAVAAARNAKRIAELDEQLFKNDAIPRRELEQAQTDALAADADVEAAAQQLRALGVDPAAASAANGAGEPVQGVIRAPISGTLVERLITPGQLLQAGSTPCFTIADLSKVWVMASVFPADLPRIAVGDAVEITAAGSAAAFPGRIDYVAALVDPNTKATSVRIVAPNPARMLKRDMYVNVAIRSRRQEQGLLVPVGAVLRDEDNQPFVFVEVGDGRYERRTIGLGSRVGDRYPVTSGLEPGDRIVSEGGLFLQFAQSQ
ncbi:MAG TPA: efflux RND transporter periplasmic adaptor subunit [Longimicrobiales bacterium]|nr:efflux RND transporter periplasmic adaptor subunit [Longimicrobiales bacterium]